MSQLLRIGVIGCGDFATRALWPSLRYASVEIAYACARRPERAYDNARVFGAQRATTNVEEVLADDSVLAVLVIGPPQMHFELGTAALEAGKHLFIEKPPAATLTQTTQLAETARRAGVQCQVGFQKRFAPGYQWARKTAADSRFGPAQLLKINYSHWRMPDWRAHLMTMSVHPIDLARFFLGDPDEAYVLKRTDPNGCSTCVLTLLYSSGPSAVINMSANDPHVQEWVEMSCSNELISVHNLIDYQHWAPGQSPDATKNCFSSAFQAWRPEFAIPYEQADSLWVQGYAGELSSFADAILAKRPVSPSIEDGVAAMRIVDAIAASADGLNVLSLT